MNREAAALGENREGVDTLGLDGTSLIPIFGLLITGGAQREREL
jgi:hypothetical protein